MVCISVVNDLAQLVALFIDLVVGIVQLQGFSEVTYDPSRHICTAANPWKRSKLRIRFC